MESGSEGKIEVKFEGPVGIIIMKRGENRLNPSFVRDMNKALDKIEGNLECRVLITTGEGKFFSNGRDLNWQKSTNEDTLASFNKALRELGTRIKTFPVPTIAAINGHVFAGGFSSISSAHDFSVMQRDRGWLCLNEVDTGYPVPAASVHLMRQKLPAAAVAEMLALGLRYNADEALAIGVIHKACDAKDLMNECMELARRFSESKQPQSREHFGNMKKHLLENHIKSYL